MDKKLGHNPKDLVGEKKVSLSKFPMTALIHGAHAMAYGASKYGPYNWRGNAVVAHIYVDAALRHLAAWFDQKQEVAEDSGVHHLAHAMACLAILLDARETGNLIDDRPSQGQAAAVLERLNALDRPTPNASGNSNSVKDDVLGQGQQPSHSKVPKGADGLVCSKSALKELDDDYYGLTAAVPY